MNNELQLDAMQRYRHGKRALLFNILINLFLALLKGLIGFFARSQAMIADGFHSFGDLLVNLVVLTGLKTANKPVDDDHPYGHGKAETLAQNIVGLLIITTGGYLIVSSMLFLREELVEPPGSLALLAAVVSIVIKEFFFRYMWKLGQRLNSRALMANAWDHRSDVLSSTAALIGIGGARAGGYLGYPLFYYLDPLAGILVSVLIVYMGISIMRDAGSELMDTMCSQETLEEICSVALQVPHVKEIHQIRARSSGPCLLVEIDIGIDGSLSVGEGHKVSHEVEKKLYQVRNDILTLTVHIGPSEKDENS